MIKICSQYNPDFFLDAFIYETNQLIESLEAIILGMEQKMDINTNEIFRIMHTIKGNAGVMNFSNMASLAHAAEDLFSILREENHKQLDYTRLADLLFMVIDYFRSSLESLANGHNEADSADQIISLCHEYLQSLKIPSPNRQKDVEISQNTALQESIKQNADSGILMQGRYRCVVFFETDSGMENVRAFLLVHRIQEIAVNIEFFPSDIADNEKTSIYIKEYGFQIEFDSYLDFEELEAFIVQTAFIKELHIEQLKSLMRSDRMPMNNDIRSKQAIKNDVSPATRKQNMISVGVTKLDILMDLVGELVIAEAMVTRNPELAEMELDSFNKASRHLRKITRELQDTVMSIRMVPLTATFQKMNRLVRDMSHKLDKNIQLVISGQETEVDKNIIDQISDPLMHLIRNSIDHGIEDREERKKSGKDETGIIVLDARNAGGDVWISVKDDGRGLNKEKIINKARAKNLLNKSPDQLSDREIYSMILLPGFSTKDEVNEFSGRGVGMDVVKKNLEKLGGTVVIDSIPGQGTLISLRIPLTLVIIDGMVIGAGNNTFTIPVNLIKESFCSQEQLIMKDPEGNEIVMIRGTFYPLIRLQEFYKLAPSTTNPGEGILILVEDDSKGICLLADSLLGQQQVVIKPLPELIKMQNTNLKGIGGCTLLGDGSISLVIDIASLHSKL